MERLNDNNPVYRCGCSLTIILLTTDQIFCANAGDSKAVLSTIQGQGKKISTHLDLSREFKANMNIPQEEKLRLKKNGFAVRENRITNQEDFEPDG